MDDKTKTQQISVDDLPLDNEECVVAGNYVQGNPQLPSRTTKISYTPSMIKCISKCENDILYFAENFFHIVNLDRGKEKIKLYPVQRKMLTNMVKNNRFAVVASRQIGKTTIFTIFALWFTSFFNDKTILIVANKEDAAQEVMSRIRLAYEELPVWLKPGVKEWQKQSIKFLNGSTISISATSASAGRGKAINCLLVDEAAFIDPYKAAEFFKSVLPTISSSKHSKILLSSTPNGTNNYFYRVIKQAKNDPKSNWKYMSIPWHMIPGRDEQWKVTAMSDVNGDIVSFQQEYCCEFIEEGDSAIDKKTLDELRQYTHPPQILNSNEYKVWEAPNPKHIYAMGVDVSDGVGSCASCIQILDITDLTDIRHVACYNNRYIDPQNFAKEIYSISLQWGKPWIAVERNNMGAEVIDALSREPLYYERLIAYDNAKKTKYEKRGVVSSTNTKYDGISNMRYYMHILKAFTTPDASTLDEFDTFIKCPNGTYKKANGNGIYDDRVMALVWAFFVLHVPVAETCLAVNEYDENGKPKKIEKTYYDDTDGMYNLGVSILIPKPEDTIADKWLNGYVPYSQNQPTLEDLIQQGWSTM